MLLQRKMKVIKKDEYTCIWCEIYEGVFVLFVTIKLLFVNCMWLKYYFFFTYLLAFTGRLVDMTMRVELLLTEPCDQARNYVTSLARSRLSTISVLWGQGLCGQSACSNVSVICPSNPAGAPSLTAVFSSIRLEDTAQFIINLCLWKLYF